MGNFHALIVMSYALIGFGILWIALPLWARETWIYKLFVVIFLGVLWLPSILLLIACVLGMCLYYNIKSHIETSFK